MGKTLTNEPFTKFDEQNFDKLIVGFKGEALEKNVGRKNFDESVAIHQNHQSFSSSNFCAIRY